MSLSFKKEQKPMSAIKICHLRVTIPQSLNSTSSASFFLFLKLLGRYLTKLEFSLLRQKE